MTNKLHIRELDLELILPNTKTYQDPNDKLGGNKIVVIGKPGVGKSILIKSILFEKKHIFPCGVFVSGSEENNKDLQDFVPSIFIYNEYDEKIIDDFQTRQKYAIDHLGRLNPWSVCLLDDCTDKPQVFNTELQHGMFKRGRHKKMLYLVSLQYGLDVRPAIRTCIDGTFIMREPNLKNRKLLWENYGGIIPDFKLFCDILDKLTGDFTAVYIHNRSQSNKIEDCVFYYKADKEKIDKANFKFGAPEIWDYHNERYDPNNTY